MVYYKSFKGFYVDTKTKNNRFMYLEQQTQLLQYLQYF